MHHLENRSTITRNYSERIKSRRDGLKFSEYLTHASRDTMGEVGRVPTGLSGSLSLHKSPDNRSRPATG